MKDNIFEEVISLPIEDRILLIDMLLKSLTYSKEEIEIEWFKIAEKRKEEILCGKAKLIPSEDVKKVLYEHLKK